MKRIIPLILSISCSAALLTGCSELTRPGPSVIPYTDTDTTAEVETYPNKNAIAKPTPYVLDEDYFSKYIDMERFDKEKLRTERGIEITRQAFNITDNQVRLWLDMIDMSAFNPIDVNDLDAMNKMLLASLDELMQKHAIEKPNESFESMYNMKKNELDAFVSSQAKTYMEQMGMQ